MLDLLSDRLSACVLLSWSRALFCKPSGSNPKVSAFPLWFGLRDLADGRLDSVVPVSAEGISRFPIVAECAGIHLHFNKDTVNFFFRLMFQFFFFFFFFLNLKVICNSLLD